MQLIRYTLLPLVSLSCPSGLSFHSCSLPTIRLVNGTEGIGIVCPASECSFNDLITFSAMCTLESPGASYLGCEPEMLLQVEFMPASLLVLTPVPTSEVCISKARCFGRFKESRDSLVRLVLSLLSIVHNVTTEFAWIHHPPYRFSHVSISSS